MKKLFALIAVLFFVFVSVSFAGEQFGFPANDGTGSIGKYQRSWGNLWIKNQNVGYLSTVYASGTGATQSVTNTSPAVLRITGGSGSTSYVMSYTGHSSSNTGKIFYIINSSSNSVQFKQTGATGVTVATNKIVTVVGNGSDFVRITADQ